MKLKIDNREKKLIKLLELYKKEFSLKNIECTVEKLDLVILLFVTIMEMKNLL